MKKLLAVLLLLLVNHSYGQSSKKWLDVNYAGDSLTGHRMDIYLPEKREGPYPVIVAIAGSAWFGENTKDRAFKNVGGPLLDHGFAVVAVNHRSSRKATFPAQINDIKGAVRFLRANARKYQLDTRFVGITGDSSGGHLSALMGTSGGVDKHTVGKRTLSIEGDLGGNAKESSRVDAVVDWYGPTSIHKMGGGHNAPGSPECTLIGGSLEENADLCALVDPITYIDSSDPPFLIVHGDADPVVPHGQSVLLDEALKEKGVKSEMITVPGGEHGKGIWLDKYKERMVAFFTEAKNGRMGGK